MKKTYFAPSFNVVEFDLERVLFDASDFFQKDEDGIGGDSTMIKPFE